MTEASGEQTQAANPLVGGSEQWGTKPLGESGVIFMAPFP